MKQEVLDFLQNLFANPIASKTLGVIVGVFVILLLFRLFRQAVSRYVKAPDTRYKTRKAVSLIGYSVAVIFALSVFSDSLAQLTLIVGGVGAGVAFALQEVIASLAGWIAIALGQFYKPGDRVLLGGIMGDVIDISFLRTTLMDCGDWVKGDLYNGRIVRVANSFVFKEPVFNYSADFPFLWDEITVPIQYGCDRPLAKSLLQRVAEEVVGGFVPEAESHWGEMVQKYLIENSTVQPMVTLVANDNWMEYTIRYVVSYKQRRLKKDALFNRILDEIDQTHGQISLASATFHLVAAPPLDVSLNSGIPLPKGSP